MATEAPRSSAPERVHLLLFDGVCGLCDRLNQFVLAHDRRGVFHFAALQSAAARAHLKRFGSNPDDLAMVYVLVDYRTATATQLAKGRAALFVMRSLGWPWRAAGLLGVLPNPMLDWLYDLVARNRYRAFGRYERCLLPRPEYRSRFID